MSEDSPSFVEILRRQFNPSFQMLGNLIEACPDALWTSRASGNPFWQQIAHALIGIQFWFRDAEEKFVAPDFGQGPIADLDVKPVFQLSKHEIWEYMEVVAKRVDAFFKRMSNATLLKVSSIYDKCTNADIIMMQIRHVQHHVGYCNSLLHSNKVGTIKWLGFAE